MQVRRRTWLTGGVLLLTAGFLGLVRTQLLPAAALGWAGTLLAAAALVVFAIGFGAAGSVTARRPLGTIALLALAAWEVLSPLLWTVFAGILIGASFESLSTLDILTRVLSLIFAMIAVWQIVRVAVIPRPWNWAPLWALAAFVAAQVLPYLAEATGIRDQETLVLMHGFAGVVLLAGNLFLGVLAIMLAVRPARSSTVSVYPPQ